MLDDNDCEDECEDECEGDEPDPDWCGTYVESNYDSFVKGLEAAGFTYLNYGSFRKAYERNKVVIKVPIVSDGIIDNMVEHRAYHRYRNKPLRNGIILAPCRLLPNGCLMMVKCTWEDGYRQLPKWASLIDGRQVGPYKGRIVAYDYALDLTDRFKWEKEWKQSSRFFNSTEWRERRPHIDTFLQRQERRQLKAG